MPYVYFGMLPRGRGATKLSVKTSRGDLEPVEPSRLKVFITAPYIPLLTILYSVFGLMASLLTYPKYSYVPISQRGLYPKSVSRTIPFDAPGLAIVFKKGFRVYEEISQKFESKGFSMMQFAGRTIWLKEGGTRDDYLEFENLEGVDDTGPSPARYLNTASFQAFLSLLSTTTIIAKTFLSILPEGEVGINEHLLSLRSVVGGDWVLANSNSTSDDTPVVTEAEAKFKKSEAFLRDLVHEKNLSKVMIITGSASAGISSSNSAALINSIGIPSMHSFPSGRVDFIKTGGLIFKFNPKLALPDPNSIGDVLGRHFRHCLGESHEEQFDNLHFIKSGLSALRLTRVGDEISHLYRCFELAIQGNSYCVPFFSASAYEGCLIMNPVPFSLSINGETVSSLSMESLRREFADVSDHTAGLTTISKKFPEASRGNVLEVRSMVDLRRLCLSLECSQESRDDIIAAAAYLDFGSSSWVINPANLKAALSLMTNLEGDINESYPISRLTLFSRDVVFVALSCFGEKTAPSWDLPNGTSCSLKEVSPPIPPAGPALASAKRSITSDATWVMVIRTTDIFTAVDEFRRMGETGCYRSIPSATAKKSGHRVFSRDRMGGFWSELRAALVMVNPSVDFRVMGEALKRKRESDEGSGPLGGGVRVKRRPGF
jgi:hypothetical protein